MEIYPSQQALLTLMCAALGAATGACAEILYELYAPLPSRLRGALVCLVDIAAVGVVMLGIAVFAFYFDMGRVRAVYLLGAAVGYALYKLLLSHLVKRAAALVFFLVRSILRILWLPCAIILKKCIKFLKICKFYLYKALEKIGYLLYNIYNNIKLLKWAEYGFVFKDSRRTKKR